MASVADQAARDLAVDVTKSVIVEAGAGSGKTASLVVRKLGLLALVKSPEEVLSITFTRKATGEMRNRVIGALRSVAMGAIATSAYEETLFENARAALARDKEMGWSLLDNPSRLRIVTFDALAHMVVRMSPITSQLGGPVRIQEDATKLYDRAIDRLFALLEDDSQPELSSAIFHFFRLMDNRQPRARDFLKSLLIRRDQWLPHLMGSDSREAFYELINESTRELALSAASEAHHSIETAGVANTLPQLWAYAASNGAVSPAIQALASTHRFPSSEDQSPEFWVGVCQMLMTASGGFRKRLTAKEGFPATGKLKGDEKIDAVANKALFEQVVEALNGANVEAAKIIGRAGALPQPLDGDSDALDLMDTLIHILPILSAELRLVFSEEGVADHSHVFQAALQALGTELAPGEASLALDYQISHILVDEYQDTSKPQTRLLRQLTAGWAANDGRTMFVVGDPKQSVYKFRDANVANFLSARKMGIGDVRLTPVSFTENFRSSSTIIEWNNMVYGPAFPANENIERSEVTFAPSTVPEGAKSGDDVTVRGFVGFPDATRPAEGQYVAEQAQKVLVEHPGDSVAILIRNRSHLREILPALRQHNVAWRASDIDPLSSLGVVSDLLSLTRAIINPMDKLAWMAVVRSPLVGLTVAEMERFIGTRSHVWAALTSEKFAGDDDGSALIRRFISVMGEALKRYRRKPLRQLVEGAWVALGGPSTAIAFNELEAANCFLDLVSQHELGGSIMDIDELESAVARLYASDLNSSESAVEIMTIHKAKGLQFDTVFLPGLANGSRPEEKSLMYWSEWLNERGEYRLAMAPMAPPGTRDVPLYDYLRSTELEKGRQEMTRLLYVATTRPTKRLFMSFAVTEDADGKPRSPGSATLIGSIWPSVEAQTLFTSPVNEQLLAEVNTTVVHLDRQWAFRNDALVSPLSQYRGATHGFGADNVPKLLWDNAVAAASGTVFHRFVQHLHEVGVREVKPEDAYRHKNFWENQLRTHGLPIAKINDGLAIVKAAFVGLDSEDGRWLLADHEQKEAEKPVTIVTQGETEDLVIDLTFVSGGERWVIDTKTSSPAPGESETAFMARELERYQSKMEQYGHAVSHLGDEPVRLALYLPVIGKIADYQQMEKAA